MSKTRLAAIDFGTSKIVTLVAENSSNTRCDIIGIGIAPYAGYVPEGWNEPEKLDEAITASVRDAEKQLRGTGITEISAGVPAAFTKVYASDATITLKGTEPRVTPADVSNAIATAENKIKEQLPMGVILHSSPAWFRVDGERKTLEPVGKKGRELTVLISVVIADKFFVDEVTSRLTNLNLTVANFYSSAVGEAMLVLPPEERDRTAVLVDIGYLTTDVMIAEGDAVIYLKTIEMGGGNISADLAMGLNIRMEEAEDKIKRQYIYGIDTGDTYEVGGAGGTPVQTFTREQVSEVLIPRVDEIAEEIQKAIAESGINLNKGSSIYLTGGGLSFNRGGRDYLAGKLGRPVREPAKHTTSLNSHSYTSSLGLMDLIIDQLEVDKQRSASGGKLKQFFTGLFRG